MVNQLADQAPNTTTTGQPITTTIGNVTTAATTNIVVSSIMTIDMQTSNQQSWTFGGTNAVQLQRDRYNRIRQQLINWGVPSANIRRGTTTYGVPFNQMGGKVNQTTHLELKLAGRE